MANAFLIRKEAPKGWDGGDWFYLGTNREWKDEIDEANPWYREEKALEVAKKVGGEVVPAVEVKTFRLLGPGSKGGQKPAKSNGK